jgi:hypothetical protein
VKEQEFDKVIADLVIALEKAGVYNDELKATIDNLFHLKDVIRLRELSGREYGSCGRCSYYDKGVCNFLSATTQNGIQIELPPAKKISVPVKVPISFRCNFYKA